LSPILALAPKRGIQQIEAELKNSMGELTSQNVVMEGYMKQVLDSLQGMQSKIDEIQGALVETTSAVTAGQHRAEELTARLTAIESSPRTALKHVTVPPLDAGVGTGAEANPLGSPRVHLLRVHLRKFQAPGQLTAAIQRFTGEMRLVSWGYSALPRSQVPNHHLMRNLLYQLNLLNIIMSMKLVMVLVGVDLLLKWIFLDLRGRIPWCGSRTAKHTLNCIMFLMPCVLDMLL
jgi:DNA-binding protein YbaB